MLFPTSPQASTDCSFKLKQEAGPASRRCSPRLVALPVCLQTVALSEGFVADAALIRSLSAVRSHVNS